MKTVAQQVQELIASHNPDAEVDILQASEILLKLDAAVKLLQEQQAMITDRDQLILKYQAKIVADQRILNAQIKEGEKEVKKFEETREKGYQKVVYGKHTKALKGKVTTILGYPL